MKTELIKDYLDQAINIAWILSLITPSFSVWWNSVAIIFAIGLSVIKMGYNPGYFKRFHLKNGQLLPIAVYLTYVMSITYSTDLSWGFELLFRQIMYLSIPVTMVINQEYFARNIFRYFNVFLYALAASCIVILFLNMLPQETLLDLSKSSSLMTDYKFRAKRMIFGGYSPFVDRLRYCYLLGAGSLLLIWQMFRDRISISRVSMLILFLATQIMLGSRGAQLALLAAMAFWGLYYLQKRLIPWLATRIGKGSAYLVAVSLFLGTAIGGPIILYKNVTSVNQRYNQLQWELQLYNNGKMTKGKDYDYWAFTSVRRILSWDNTWKVIKDNPILGVGIGDWEEDLGQKYQEDQYVFPMNSHQQFLHNWMIGGLLGIGALLLMLIGFMIKMARAEIPIDRILGYSFIIFWSVTFLFDIPLWYQTSRVGFLMLFGMILLVRKLD